MNVTYTCADVGKRHYAPPALGNGKLSLSVDCDGVMTQQEYCGMTPVIVRSGCRYDNADAKLIRFGFFEQELPNAGKRMDFSQTLDLEHACCDCVNNYGSGLRLDTRIFCHADRDIIAIRKLFSRGDSSGTEFRFRYVFPETPYLQIRNDGGGRLFWRSGVRHGEVRLYYSPGLTLQDRATGILELSGKVSAAEIFLVFDDSLRPGDTFDSLFASHCAEWKRYWSVGRISVPDMELMKMYMTAQYHLRISSTPWSVPTGLFPTHWEGRYFGYDEFYTHGALLTSGHFAEAEKIVRFRAETLPKAVRRACFMKLCPEENLAAHYPWETLEDGSEGGPEGFWLDRYVHMANIGFSCWENWCYTKNRARLESELYPVIRACAEYIRRCGVYIDSVTGPYIGKCTDMERFGEFIERPYSTTCGAIAVFRAAAECAEILQRDAALQEQWKTLAEQLCRALPVENDRYVPYPGCRQHSIAMYHGLYPYGVIRPDDPKQTAAILETEENFREFAGQYFQGGSLSAWYAGVIATAEIRRGNAEKALSLLSRAAGDSTGCFYECFEVYEQKKLPWFSTASGAVVRAVNELLLYAAGKNIDLWPGREFSCELPTRHGDPESIEQNIHTKRRDK